MLRPLLAIRHYSTKNAAKPLISITNGTFRPLPSSSHSSSTWFPDLSFHLPAPTSSPPPKWSILGSGKRRFLEILQGKHICDPPTSRTYPLLVEKGKWPHQAIELVSFGSDQGSGMLRGGTGGHAYLSARYETLREEFDLSLREWLVEGIVKSRAVTAWEEGGEGEDAKRLTTEEEEVLGKAVAMLKLGELLEQSVMTLSNGQSRRARIASALLKRSEVLLLDEPFMGLDPPSRTLLSTLLSTLLIPQVLLGLRPQDPIPTWSTHLVFTTSTGVLALGPKSIVIETLKSQGIHLILEGEAKREEGLLEKIWAGVGDGKKDVKKEEKQVEKELPEALVEMKDVKIKYYDKEILNGFSWTIRRGEKWGLFGPNGSGKTTLISLITSDHPQTYSLPIKHFGRSRLPKLGTPGISIFDIQSRIGYSSPEVHAFFPKHLSLRRAVLSGFAETFLSPPSMTEAQKQDAEGLMEIFAQFLQNGVNWEEKFGAVELSTQRMVLFLRAIVKKPDLVVLDEAFSGMEESVRRKCFEVLGSEIFDEERQAMVIVSHVAEEIPEGVKKWVRLAEWGSGGEAEWGIVE